MHVPLLRAVGAGTALYGAAVALRPGLLARPCGLADGAGRTLPEVARCLRPLAARDLAVGLAMACAPAGPALRSAAVLRLTADAADAVLLGATLPTPRTRGATVALCTGWAAVSLLGLLTDSPRRRRWPRRR